jgi:hypothetical protein
MVDLVDQMSNPKSDAAVAGRLQALAQVGARWKHDIACCSIEAPFPRIGHDRAFDQCRHPDCVLVRAALQEAPQEQSHEDTTLPTLQRYFARSEHSQSWAGDDARHQGREGALSTHAEIRAIPRR